jgi:hypothetical protein
MTVAAHCTDCGEEHDSIEETVDKLRQKNRMFLVGYFLSLAFIAFCLFKILGVYGALGLAAAFGVYFFHLNMVGYTEAIASITQAQSQATTASPHVKLTPGGGGSEAAGSGQYI